MYNIKLPSKTEFTIPKENLLMLAHITAYDCGRNLIFCSDNKCIGFLMSIGIEVTSA